MASPIYKVFVAVGLLCILHAAYSAAQHRTYLRLTKTEFLALPLDIAIQVRTPFFGVTKLNGLPASVCLSLCLSVG